MPSVATPALAGMPGAVGWSVPAPASRAPGVARSSGVRRGRWAAAAVAAGALATAGHGVADLADGGTGHTDAPTAELSSLALPAASSHPAAPDPATSGVLPATAAAPAAGHVGSLAKAARRAAPPPRPAAVPVARFVKPATGTFTSGFGSRWGAEHKGVDIANAIGTPIVSVADGVVTAAGPASGFGQWVKVRLADGSETVYGHVNRFFVQTGDRVRAGQRIAEIGNKGESTGPHLHFEVHTPGGVKINPLPWLAERGIALGSLKE